MAAQVRDANASPVPKSVSVVNDSAPVSSGGLATITTPTKVVNATMKEMMPARSPSMKCARIVTSTGVEYEMTEVSPIGRYSRA